MYQKEISHRAAVKNRTVSYGFIFFSLFQLDNKAIYNFSIGQSCSVIIAASGYYRLDLTLGQ